MNTRESIGPALGKIASGLFIATAQVDGAPVGMLCSFVEQAGFEPPMISIAIGFDRPISPAFEGPGIFGLNILGKQNGDLVKSFARPSAASFEKHALVENVWSLPQFAEAWAFLACKVAGKVSSGDHIVYVAEVLGGILQQEGQEPMIRIRANGFGY